MNRKTNEAVILRINWSEITIYKLSNYSVVKGVLFTLNIGALVSAFSAAINYLLGAKHDTYSCSSDES